MVSRKRRTAVVATLLWLASWAAILLKISLSDAGRLYSVGRARIWDLAIMSNWLVAIGALIWDRRRRSPTRFG